MWLRENSTKNSGNDSTASSVESTESYSVFGSACSECSNCHFDRERAHGYNNFNRMSGSSNNLSFQSAADRETSHLLLAPHFTYKTIGSSSETLGPGELSASDIIATYKRTIQKHVKIEKNKQSSLVTIFSIWNTIMGSSLLTMAWGVERAGLPVALFLLTFMGALCLYTAYILLRVNYHHGGETCEVPALCRTLLGTGAAAVAHAFSMLVLLGANVLYWLLISNFLYYTVDYLIDLSSSNTTYNNASVLCPSQDTLFDSTTPLPAPSLFWGLHTTVPFYVAVIVFPLLNFTKVSTFTKFNSLGTLSVFYLLIFILVKGWTWGVHVEDVSDWHRGIDDAAVLSGMLALSFYIHNIIITIMSNNARQDRNGRDLTIAFSLVMSTYALVGVVFYICFPLAKSCIEDNILNNFDMHDVMTAIARALFLFQIITVYPLVVFMIRCEAAQLWARAADSKPALAINIAAMALGILVSCLCPDIGTIIRYTGAISGLVHVFTLPALLQMRSLQLRGQLTTLKTIFYISIIAFGTLNLVMQFFIA